MTIRVLTASAVAQEFAPAPSLTAGQDPSDRRCDTSRPSPRTIALRRIRVPPVDEWLMSSEIMRQIIETIEADALARPSAIEFEMAYQVRVAIDRIKFAIRHADQFGKPCDAMREAGMQLLDGLQRLESVDRRFQTRSRMAEPH